MTAQITKFIFHVPVLAGAALILSGCDSKLKQKAPTVIGLTSSQGTDYGRCVYKAFGPQAPALIHTAPVVSKDGIIKMDVMATDSDKVAAVILLSSDGKTQPVKQTDPEKPLEPAMLQKGAEAAPGCYKAAVRLG